MCVCVSQAHVIRNAGGRIREAIRSVIVSQALLGTEELAIIHHTECGVLKFDDEQIRDQVMRQQTEQRGLMRRKEQQQRAHEKQHSKPKARRVQAHVVDGLPATDAAFSTDDIGIVSDDDTESCSDDEEEELKTSAAAADAAYLASVATAVNATPFLSFFGSPEESVLNDMAEYRTSSLVKKTIPCRGFVYGKWQHHAAGAATAAVAIAAAATVVSVLTLILFFFVIAQRRRSLWHSD